MDSKEKRPPFSLNAFIEQTAKILRNAVKRSTAKKSTKRKKSDLSNGNKIEQIALLLRTEVKKLRPRKKKRD